MYNYISVDNTNIKTWARLNNNNNNTFFSDYIYNEYILKHVSTIVAVINNVASATIVYLIIVARFIIDFCELLVSKMMRPLTIPIAQAIKNVMPSKAIKTLYEIFLPGLNLSVASMSPTRRYIINIIRINATHVIKGVTTNMVDLLFCGASFWTSILWKETFILNKMVGK